MLADIYSEIYYKTVGFYTIRPVDVNMKFLFRYPFFSLVVVLLCIAPMAVQAAVVNEIRFKGNKTTKPIIMLQEMRLKVGDPIDLPKIEKDRQAIMDLGLFKLVYADMIEEAGRQVLEITVSEKYYIFPLPKLDRSADGDVSYGVRLKMDNIAGLNQRLRLTYKRVDSCCEAFGMANEFDASFNYPRIAGSAYGMSVVMLYIDSPVDDKVTGGVISVYERDYQSFSFGVSRWLRQDEPSVGWSASIGPFWRSAKYQHVSGIEGLFSDGVATGANLGIGYGRVHDRLYSREGTEYGFSIQVGSRLLGSDESFTHNSLYYRRYYYLNDKPHHNLNAQLKLGFSGGNLPLGGDFFSVGGSNSIRGYEKGSISGESFFTLNVEYLAPLHDSNEMRGVLFSDIGNAYHDNRTIDLTDFEASVGFGLRYKIKSFVKVDLRFDTAYALGIEDLAVYFSSKGTF